MSTSMATSAAAQPAAEIHIDPGAMVSVINMDGEAHTVTADSGNAFDDMATAGKTTMFKAPDKPGSYPFHCTYHSNMHGVLIVK
jgi:plastocyanin